MHQPGLSANLDSFDLLDLAQVIQMARRDLSLVVRAGSQSLGVLRFSQGELLWAEFGTLRGEEAFIALAAQHTGSIEEHAWDGRRERNVNQPLARLVMQAVEYRDTHGNHYEPQASGSDNRSRPIQPAPLSQLSPPLSAAPLASHDRFNGSNSRPRLVNPSPPEPEEPLPEDEQAPSWVQQIHAASEAFSAQSTTIIPPVSGAAPPAGPGRPSSSFYSAQTEPLAPPQPPSTQPLSSSLLQEEMDIHIPEPIVPFSALHGKFVLPSLANGSQAAARPSDEPGGEPPTVPLPSVQGGLRDYGAKHESHPRESQREAEPGIKQAIKPAPAAPALSVPATAPAPPVPTAPPGEPKMSSLSILEQLAYGGFGNNSSAERASTDTNRSVDNAAEARLVEPPTGPQASSRLLDGASARQNDTLAALSAPSSSTSASVGALPASSGLAAPSSATGSVERIQHLRQVLHTFAEQVGAACIATALIRADGALLAEYHAQRGQDQDLGSPAYHMANVMQSSLRTLLMGGWGDLEDTIITGNTHSVVLRRLGRAEKGVFHVAVLERSGNPGLCRVRMRNNEAALLQRL
ncbi:MAG TPA: DUF4388 domain-containing protein [Ktedonobacterales bacterium]